MFVTTVSNFDKVPYNIPEGQASSDGVSFKEQFQAFIDTKEPEILKKLLGVDLYNEFIAGLGEDYPEDKWLNLRDGANYSFNSVTYEWVGLEKLLTPFIYAEWLRANFDTHQPTGIQVPNVENALVSSPNLRIVSAWNDFYEKGGNECNPKNSLFGFLQTNKEEDYSSWVFTDVGAMNRFNL